MFVICSSNVCLICYFSIGNDTLDCNRFYLKLGRDALETLKKVEINLWRVGESELQDTVPGFRTRPRQDYHREWDS